MVGSAGWTRLRPSLTERYVALNGSAVSHIESIPAIGAARYAPRRADRRTCCDTDVARCPVPADRRSDSGKSVSGATVPWQPQCFASKSFALNALL